MAQFQVSGSLCQVTDTSRRGISLCQGKMNLHHLGCSTEYVIPQERELLSKDCSPFPHPSMASEDTETFCWPREVGPRRHRHDLLWESPWPQQHGNLQQKKQSRWASRHPQHSSRAHPPPPPHPPHPPPPPPWLAPAVGSEETGGGGVEVGVRTARQAWQQDSSLRR